MIRAPRQEVCVCSLSGSAEPSETQTLRNHRYSSIPASQIAVDEGLLGPGLVVRQRVEVRASIDIFLGEPHLISPEDGSRSRYGLWVENTTCAPVEFVLGENIRRRSSLTRSGCRLVSNSSMKTVWPFSRMSSHGPASAKSLRVPADCCRSQSARCRRRPDDRTIS